MLRAFVNARIHRATVTHGELHHDGSCAVDELMVEASGIGTGEQIGIYNTSGAERLGIKSV